MLSQLKNTAGLATQAAKFQAKQKKIQKLLSGVYGNGASKNGQVCD